MSGSICAPTASRTAASRPTATSSTLPARPGTPSPQSRPSYNPSECENGRTPVNHEGRWYHLSTVLGAALGRSGLPEVFEHKLVILQADLPTIVSEAGCVAAQRRVDRRARRRRLPHKPEERNARLIRKV